MRDIWIAGIARGHNSGVCLLKNGEIVFVIEEERLTRTKYDGTPMASIVKILDYTDKLDFFVISHTQPDESRTDYNGEKIYESLVRKLGLIDDPEKQIVEMHEHHHKMHASCAFYQSGFEKAVALIVDGAGTFYNLKNGFVNEVESIFDCSYPDQLVKTYSRLCGNGPIVLTDNVFKDGCNYIMHDGAGIVKAYEGVTSYCGWTTIEAGKTMGLFPYGKPNDNIPPIFSKPKGQKFTTTNHDLFIPDYPSGSKVNAELFSELDEDITNVVDVTKLQSRRDMAYAVQTETQQQVLELIRKAVKDTGQNNVVISGGYGLNCVANYWYLEQLKDEGINIYVEPVSNDAGTAMGAALLMYYTTSGDTKVRGFNESLYLGPVREYSNEEVIQTVGQFGGVYIENQQPEDAVDLILDGKIVTIFQDRCENGPRALGNRSILFDPRTQDGKDYVNSIKHREYFRPFAGSILHEFAHEWFDMRGLEESPHMMYAMNCQPGVEEKIPAIIHIDGTCRIQTVKEHQNPIYYEMIKDFYNKTGVPILFNTSFNLGGEPLVETLSDAIHTLRESDIEYLYIPNNKMIIKVENNE